MNYTRAVIHARKLSKRFGDKRVLEKLDLEVPRGGFLLVTGPNGSGKTTLAPALRRALRADRRRARGRRRRAARSASSAHEPLVYRELTPLENLDLYGRLYRLPERRERAGMMLERFGLWRVAERAGRDVLARDAPAARALPRAPPRPRPAAPRRAVRRARRRGRRPARTPSSRERTGVTALVATHDPEALAAPRDGQARARMSAYAGDVAALARKDLLLELRSRDTLPAMLLFVVSALSIFHFALPSGSSERAGDRPALDRDRLHGAPRADARLRGRARAGSPRRARARAVRPERDLARQDDRRRRCSSSWPRSSRCPPSRSSSTRCPGSWSPRSRSPTSGSRRSARSSPRSRLRAGRASCCCRSSSCRSRSRS